MFDENEETMEETKISEPSHVLSVGLSMDPITDFVLLQQNCPEVSIIINYLEKGILPTDRKWKQRVEHDAKLSMMKS